MVQKQADIGISLEGGNLHAPDNIDLNLLQEAEKYHIDLSDLENIIAPKVQKETNHKKQSESWRKLDVSLSSVINLIVATSERPTFLIRDDKLVYLNPAAMQLLGVNVDKEVVGNKFFNLVAREDWNLLAENIGEMLTNAKQLKIRLKSASGKIHPMNFQAIYLSEIEHFSFILLGEHTKKATRPAFNNLYDDVTGLPNFFLFEDRVQVAISSENIKENVRDQNMIAVAAINIDNIEVFRKMHIEEMIIKKAANNLVLNLPKSATVALGLKYNFWVMLTGLKNKAELNHEIRHLFAVLDEGISDNFTRHELLFSIGVSSFPQPAHSAKKVIEQAISAIKTAQNTSRSSVEFFVGEHL